MSAANSPQRRLPAETVSRCAPGDTNCRNLIGIGGDRSCPELVQYIHCRNCPVHERAGQTLFERPPPEHYAEEWTERIAKPTEASRDDSIPVVLFRYGSEWFALDVRYAVEVATLRPIRRVPLQRQPMLAGLVNIRGELQPAIALQATLGALESEPAQPAAGDERRLLVTEYEGLRWVLMVDAVEKVAHIPRESLTALPSTVAVATKTYTQALFEWRTHKVGYLHAGRFYQALVRAFA